MKPSQFLNIGLRPFALIASAKQQLSCLAFLAITLLCPSLRAGIVYNVAQTTSTVNPIPVSSGSGNSFFTSSSNTKLTNISLYFSKSASNVTGTIAVNIYRTTGSGGKYVTTGPSLASRTYDASLISSTNITTSPLVGFNFASSNLVLTANTHYAFIATASSSGSIYTSYVTNPYSNVDNLIYNGGPLNQYAISGIVETTAVPEPGTLILTGSALLAGAIGVYFTRRHRDQALTPAAV